MSFPVFVSPFRDYFHSDMWQNFGDPFYGWGFQQPRMRRRTPKRNGTFVKVTDPWALPLDVQEKRTKSKRKDPANVFEDPVEMPSTTDLNKMGKESNFEKECKPTADAQKPRRSRSCNLSKHLPQDNKNLANRENDKNEFIHSGPKAVVNANKLNESWEQVEQTQSSEESGSEIEGEYKKGETYSQPEEREKSTEDNEHLEKNNEKNEETEEINSLNDNDIGELSTNRDDKEKNSREIPKENQPAKIENKSHSNEMITEKLATINTELSNARVLLDRVNKFNGTTEDKEYLCLQELLLRCILSLDVVDSEGLDEVKIARRSAVKEIQKIINELESKV